MRYKKFAFALCTALLALQSGAQHGLHEQAEGSKAAGSKALRQAAKKSAFPVRKHGLWEVTFHSEELTLKRRGQVSRKGQTVQQCTSAEVERIMLLSIAPGQENCKETVTARSAHGDGYSIHTVCYVHDRRVDMQMEITGDMQSSYEGRFAVQYDQAPLNNTGPMFFEGRWLGPCKNDQRPGDMVLPNNATVNVVDDRKRVEKGTKGNHGH